MSDDGLTPETDPNFYRKERRKQRRLEALGANEPRCGTCGEDDWRCLELHHVAGQEYSQSKVILCRNCHRKTSDPQKDHPIASASPPSFIEVVAHFLLGMADLFALLVENCRKFASDLLAHRCDQQISLGDH